MDNKYLYPVDDNGNIYIDTVVASSYKDAKEKIIRQWIEDEEYDAPEEWNDFINYMSEHWIDIGDPTDIETL